MSEKEQNDNMGFLDHLEELRGCIMKSLIAVLVGSFLAAFFADTLLNYLIQPVGKLVFLKPTEAFITRLKVIVFGGIVISSPAILYQFWRFLMPALYKKERALISSILPLSFLLFFSGIFMAFNFVLPAALKFLLDAGNPNIEAAISFNFYITFLTHFLLAFGVIFQLPLVIFFLMKLEIVDHDFFSKNRKYAVLIIFVMAAILTPGPDVFSQMMMALPTLFLYEISLLFSKWALPKRTSNSEV